MTYFGRTLPPVPMLNVNVPIADRYHWDINKNEVPVNDQLLFQQYEDKDPEYLNAYGLTWGKWRSQQMKRAAIKKKSWLAIKAYDKAIDKEGHTRSVLWEQKRKEYQRALRPWLWTYS